MIQVVLKPGMLKMGAVGLEGVKPTYSELVNPHANIQANEGGWKIQVAVPGLGKEDVRLAIEGNKLTVKGTYPEKAAGEIRTLRREFGHGQLSRSFLLPENAELQSIQAKCAEGILEIWIPKKVALQVQVG